jgi:transcriptional regulator GlxA family with amidase domain
MILDDLFRADGLMQIAELLRLLHEIQRDGAARELASAGYSLQSPDRHLERLEAVLTHIHTHSAGALTIGGLARLAGMSDTVFHRHFRDRMGRTPVAYIQDVRLSNVAHRLLESEASVAEIAFEAGFNNLSNFNQQFRRAFGCTPRGYRRQIGSR